MAKFEIDESIKNSLTAVAKLLFSPDFRHPTSNSSFEFLFQYSAIDDRAIKVKLEEGFKFINGNYVYGIIISLEGIYPNSDPVSKKK